MPDSRRSPFARHLEHLGYRCEAEPNGWIFAGHPVRPDFYIRPGEWCVRFFTVFRLGLLSDAKRRAWLEFLNRMHEDTLVARFALVEESTTAFCVHSRAVAPGEYRRAQFGVWVDAWNRDVDLLRQGPSLEEEPDVEDDEHQAEGEETTVN